MNHETKELLRTLLATDELRRFQNDFLVDMFRIWDCYAQGWIENSPILLRFESDDVVFRMNDNGPCEFKFGAVDTSTAIEPNDPTNPNGECLCWLRAKDFA